MIRVMWETYKADVVPADAGMDQLLETRRAFYAGAAATLAAFRLTCDMSDEDGIAVLQRVGGDIDEFAALVAMGGA